MKSLLKLTRLKLVLILLIFPLYLANGQSITVSKDYIQFDSLAAEMALNEIKMKDTILIYQDSLITTLEAEKSKAETNYRELLKWYDGLRTENMQLNADLIRERKERKIWMRSVLGIGVVIIGLLSLK